MNTPFSFLSGEWKVSMPLVFSTKNWQHSCTAERLLMKNGAVFRERQPRNSVKGLILYADLDDKNLERTNALTVINSRVPCWPNPGTLLRMIDRHSVLAECASSDFWHFHHGHNTLQLDMDDLMSRTSGDELVDAVHELIVQGGHENGVRYPAVLKVGNLHRGEGKRLVRSRDEFQRLFSTEPMKGVVTIEPFFEGSRSVRILKIGDRSFGIEVTNESSWIKNSAGADVHEFDFRTVPFIHDHAMMVAEHFNLDVAGIDYVIDQAGQFRFLECNHVPGWTGFDEVLDASRTFLRTKMTEIEDASV